MVSRLTRLLVAWHVGLDGALGMVAFAAAYAVRFEKDGAALLAGDSHGTLRRWELELPAD